MNEILERVAEEKDLQLKIEGVDIKFSAGMIKIIKISGLEI